MRKITKDELFYMSKVPRLNLVNCVTGYKSANLIGTISTEGIQNVAIFSSVTHLGTEPPLIGFILRQIFVKICMNLHLFWMKKTSIGKIEVSLPYRKKNVIMQVSLIV